MVVSVELMVQGDTELISCELCGKQLKMAKAKRRKTSKCMDRLRNHAVGQHYDETLLQCLICSHTSSYANKMSAHLKVAHGLARLSYAKNVLDSMKIHANQIEELVQRCFPVYKEEMDMFERGHSVRCPFTV